MNNSRKNIVVEEEEVAVENNKGSNGGIMSSIRAAVGMGGGKRKGTRKGKGRKGTTRKGTRKTQAGGKRGMNPYMKFAKEQRKNMPKTSNVVSQAREIGKRWRALSEAEKSRYKK